MSNWFWKVVQFVVCLLLKCSFIRCFEMVCAYHILFFFLFIKLYIYLNTRSTSENKSTLRLSSIRIVWQHVLWCTGWPKTERQNLYHCSRIKKHRLTAAQPCRYCFYSVVKNRFFALKGRYRTKFHVYRGRNVGIQPPKLSKFRILAINLPLRVTRLHNFYDISYFIRFYR